MRSYKGVFMRTHYYGHAILIKSDNNRVIDVHSINKSIQKYYSCHVRNQDDHVLILMSKISRFVLKTV